MFPPSTALEKRIADGRTLLPEFSLANMMAYFVTRKVCDGQNAGDFKHLNHHSYPLFKSGHEPLPGGGGGTCSHDPLIFLDFIPCSPLIKPLVPKNVFSSCSLDPEIFLRCSLDPQKCLS